MQRFRVEAGAVAAARARAAALGASASAAELATRAGAGATLVDEELAALLLSPHVSTEALLAIAAARRPAGSPHLETFSPLYLTNECDAECLMCGMRRTNDELVRETADAATAEAQLDILHRRGLRAVALLTGEYHHGPYRRTMIARTAEALRAALARVAHVRHRRRGGMEVYVSLPRLRKASGTPYAAGVSDDRLCRLVAVLSLGLREAKVVISTREPPAMQRRLLPVIGVLTPGSP